MAPCWTAVTLALTEAFPAAVAVAYWTEEYGRIRGAQEAARAVCCSATLTRGSGRARSCREREAAIGEGGGKAQAVGAIGRGSVTS